ncbi:hypothetical protein [Streptomyces galilaeus]|uniref:hypothetical protein n=1 Tax=Streptomyces galilaeus TaxID=33899 RepID=UPI0038F72A9C
MARSHANNGRVYRAVVIRHMADGTVDTLTYGPYDTAAPAKGQVTQWETAANRSHGQYRNPARAFTVTTRIETAEVVWKEA